MRFSDGIFLRRISNGIELKFATIFSSVLCNLKIEQQGQIKKFGSSWNGTQDLSVMSQPW